MRLRSSDGAATEDISWVVVNGTVVATAGFTSVGIGRRRHRPRPEAGVTSDHVARMTNPGA
jgi:hypothetical protein